MFGTTSRLLTGALFAGCVAILVSARNDPARADQQQVQGKLQPAATQTTKQQREKVCRARYDDCVKIKQLPPYQCSWIYNDCLANMI